MDNAHAKSPDEILRHFGTSPDGLTEQQVDKLREQYGYNGKLMFWVRLFSQHIFDFRNAGRRWEEALGADSRTIWWSPCKNFAFSCYYLIRKWISFFQILYKCVFRFLHCLKSTTIQPVRSQLSSNHLLFYSFWLQTPQSAFGRSVMRKAQSRL